MSIIYNLLTSKLQVNDSISFYFLIHNNYIYDVTVEFWHYIQNLIYD